MYSNYSAISYFKIRALSHLSAMILDQLDQMVKEKGMSNRKFDLGCRFIVVWKC